MFIYFISYMVSFKEINAYPMLNDIFDEICANGLLYITVKITQIAY